MRLGLATLITTSLAATTAAGDLPLRLPVDCDLGETCHIQQTVDHDPTDGASDFACGPLTYDTHKGTDFAVPSLFAQRAGVDVLAAAPGTVRGVRDGMPDALQIGPNAPDVTGRECGNGVLIDHGDGWETQYCHLANGSVAVRSGDRVSAGTVLGEIGLSGQTQFPHLHLSVRKEGEVIDPFAPDGVVSCEGATAGTLWKDNIVAPQGGIITAGFAPGVPEYDDIKLGSAGRDVLNPDDALVVWGYVFGGQAGDRLVLRIDGPGGALLEETVPLDRTQSQLFRAVGKRAPANGWATGIYTGEVQFFRDGAALDREITTVTVR